MPRRTLGSPVHEGSARRPHCAPRITPTDADSGAAPLKNAASNGHLAPRGRLRPFPGERQAQASGVATFQANWRDVSGKRHTANFDSASEADIYRRERLRELRRGGTGDPTGGKRPWRSGGVAGLTPARSRPVPERGSSPSGRVRSSRASVLSAWLTFAAATRASCTWPQRKTARPVLVGRTWGQR